MSMPVAAAMSRNHAHVAKFALTRFARANRNLFTHHTNRRDVYSRRFVSFCGLIFR